MVRLQVVRDRLRGSLWFVPALFGAAAVLLAVILGIIDRELSQDRDDFFVFGGTPDGARSILATIAQSMLTFTGLVFTITMLVLQLASSQLSPRVMRTFLRDRGNQIVLGLFVATFVFTLIVLRAVRTPVEGDPGFVPAVSVWAAFVLLLTSVGAFLWYIDHMAHAIRASTVIANIWTETAAAVDRLFPDEVGKEANDDARPPRDDDRPRRTIGSPRAGVVVAVDEAKLLRVASQGQRVLELLPAIGDFVPEGAPLTSLVGDWDDDAVDEIRDAIGLDDERTLDQDAAFGIRQLVDVAVRALSPGTNDPTTAVQALDRIHDILRRLACREIPAPVRADDTGVVRLVLPRPEWEDYVRLGLDEIRLSGENHIQISRRMRAVLDDLSSIAPSHRQGVLRDAISRLEAGVERGFDDPHDRAIARTPSARGHALGARDAREER